MLMGRHQVAHEAARNLSSSYVEARSSGFTWPPFARVVAVGWARGPVASARSVKLVRRPRRMSWKGNSVDVSDVTWLPCVHRYCERSTPLDVCLVQAIAVSSLRLRLGVSMSVCDTYAASNRILAIS